MSDSDEIIPKDNLNRLITVSLNELANYKIYTGFDGRELKLVNGKCDTWFESIDPNYKDYLFQIPFGRPTDPLGDWRIIIKKKQFLNLPDYWDLPFDELLDFVVEYSLDLEKDNIFYSNDPELSKYQFVKSMRKDKHNNVIGVRFDLVLKENTDELFMWVLENVNRLLTLRSEEVERLKIWAGVNGEYFGTENQFNLKSAHPILRDYSFSFPYGLPKYPNDYRLIIKYNIEKDGGSRKRKNRINRKSRK